MFTEDTMIYPKETAWFQGLDKHGQVVKLEDSDFYKEDYIGVKSLNAMKGIIRKVAKNRHSQRMPFTSESSPI